LLSKWYYTHKDPAKLFLFSLQYFCPSSGSGEGRNTQCRILSRFHKPGKPLDITESQGSTPLIKSKPKITRKNLPLLKKIRAT